MPTPAAAADAVTDRVADGAVPDQPPSTTAATVRPLAARNISVAPRPSLSFGVDDMAEPG
jgi:hypothetical protein